MENNQVLNTNDMAKYLQCSTQTVRKLIHEKVLPCFNIGRKIYVRKDTLDTWIRNQELRNIQPEEETSK